MKDSIKELIHKTEWFWQKVAKTCGCDDMFLNEKKDSQSDHLNGQLRSNQ